MSNILTEFFTQQYCHLGFLFKFFDRMVYKTDSQKMIDLYPTLQSLIFWLWIHGKICSAVLMYEHFLLILLIQYWTYLIYMTHYFHLWLQWLRYLVHTDSRWSLNTKHTENLYYTDLFYMTFFERSHVFHVGFFQGA